MRRQLLTGLIVAALSASAAAQVAKAGSGYLFRYKFAPGVTLRYKMSISMPLAGKLGSLQMPMTRKVLKVHGNVADLQISQGPLQFGGKPVGAVSKVKMSIDRLGRAVGGEDASSGVTMFPQGPIQPGHVWTSTLPIALPGMTGGSTSVVAAYRFIKMTTYHGVRAAQLSISFTKPGGTIPMSGKGTVYLLASDGNILHSTMKFSINLQRDMDAVPVTAEVTRA